MTVASSRTGARVRPSPVRRPRPTGAARPAPSVSRMSSGETLAASHSADRARGRGTPRRRPARCRRRSRSSSSSRTVSRTDREPPAATSTRSRATSVHRPRRTSTPRRRSDGRVRCAPVTARRGRRPGRPSARFGRRRIARRGGRRRHVAGSARAAGPPGSAADESGRRGRSRAAPRPGGRQPGRRAGIGQVEQDTRQLGPDEHGLGRPRIGERETRPAAGEPAETGGGRRVGQAVIGDDRLDVARADQPEPDPEAARPDGRQQARLVVGAQHDRHAGRRLLERLEQGRLGILVHPVGALDDGDPARRPRPASAPARR